MRLFGNFVHFILPGNKHVSSFVTTFFQNEGVDISRLALKFTVEQPGISTTLVSTAR